jgi:hypothetical protein
MRSKGGAREHRRGVDGSGCNAVAPLPGQGSCPEPRASTGANRRHAQSDRSADDSSRAMRNALRVLARTSTSIWLAVLPACSVVSIDDEMQALTAELRTLDAELEGADWFDTAERYKARRAAIVESRGKAADATHLIGMSDETRMAYGEVVGSVRHKLETRPDLQEDLETVLGLR